MRSTVFVVAGFALAGEERRRARCPHEDERARDSRFLISLFLPHRRRAEIAEAARTLSQGEPSARCELP